jgi:hypothetical protein
MQVYPEKDFLPPKDFVERKYSCTEEIILSKDYHHLTNPNPVLSALRYYNPGKVAKVIPERHSLRFRPHDKKLTASERKQLFRYNSIMKDNVFELSNMSVYQPFFHAEASKEWFAPHNVLAAWQQLNYEIIIPSTSETYERDILSKEEIEFLDFFSSRSHPIPRIVLARLGYDHIYEHFGRTFQFARRNYDVFESRYRAFIDEISQEPEVEEVPSPILRPKKVVKEVIPPCTTYEFWRWRDNVALPVENEVVLKAFEAIDNYLIAIDITTDIVDRSGVSTIDIRLAELRARPDIAMIETIWVRSGGQISFIGGETLFEGGGEPPPEEDFLFADDSSDEGGMFDGW